MTDMTDEELDRARDDEALDRASKLTVTPEQFTRSLLGIRVQLEREGWTPPKPVDPDLIEAREACATNRERDGFYPNAAVYRKGEFDSTINIQDALTAIKQTKAKFAAVLDAEAWHIADSIAGMGALARIREKVGL